MGLSLTGLADQVQQQATAQGYQAPAPTQPALTSNSAWNYQTQGVPKSVMDFYGNGSNYRLDHTKDEFGREWLANWEGGGGAGDGGDGGMPFLAGYRMAADGGVPGRSESTDNYFDATGKYSHDYYDKKGWLNPVTGILAVASLGALAPYMFGGTTLAGGLGGAAAGAGGAGGAAGMTGAGFGDAGMMYAGADAAAAGSLGGGASVLGGSALGTGAAAGAGGLSGLFGGGNSFGSSILQKIGTSGLSSLLGGGGSGGGATGGSAGGIGGMDMRDLIGLLGGGVDAYQQGKAATEMKDWLLSQQAKMDGYMQPGSAEYTGMWDQMSRKDAAAGRNSQYGPRTSDFLANVAKEKASNTRQFTTGTSRAYADALDQYAGRYTGLSSAAQRAAGGGGPTISSILSMLGGGAGQAAGSMMSNQGIMDLITNSGGAPIDYGAGMADPTEADVWDYMMNEDGWTSLFGGY